MQIYVKGDAKRSVDPDQIVASAIFKEHADSYDEALRRGVQTVREYLQFIQDNTDFKVEDFKTRSYSIHEQTHINRVDPKDEEDLEKRLSAIVSDGFFFTQYAYVEFDYNRERLARLLALTSKQENAPHFHIDFTLKDPKAYQRGLIGDAYHDAQRKAETLAAAADKHLRDCVRVDIDQPTTREPQYEGAFREKSAAYAGDMRSVEEEIKAIDETFQPDKIDIHKSINCVWETSD